jgi:uncharacterized protein
VRKVASVAGLVTGVAAGFVGVGGGEFRIPVLIRALHFSLHAAAGVNLVVGLFVVALGAYRRLGQSAVSDGGWTLVAIMGAVSVVGSVVGVALRHRLRVGPLGLIVRGYLILAGLWMLYESVAHAEHVLLDPSGTARWMLAGIVAFTIAVICGVLGIAGGEMRIPALLYLFGLPIVEAGTLSLLASIPTVTVGAMADRRRGGIPNAVIPVALVMGIASALGVLIGVALIPYASREVIKGVLGAVLLLSAIRLTPSAEHHARGL